MNPVRIVLYDCIYLLTVSRSASDCCTTELVLGSFEYEASVTAVIVVTAIAHTNEPNTSNAGKKSLFMEVNFSNVHRKACQIKFQLNILAISVFTLSC
jgi:hypothetical protein